jgi:hypothetical protein
VCGIQALNNEGELTGGKASHGFGKEFQFYSTCFLKPLKNHKHSSDVTYPLKNLHLRKLN